MEITTDKKTVEIKWPKWAITIATIGTAIATTCTYTACNVRIYGAKAQINDSTITMNIDTLTNKK